MIEDSKLAQPRYKGLVHGVQTIIKEEGYRGVYRGVGPVVSCPTSSILGLFSHSIHDLCVLTKKHFFTL